MKQIFLTPGPSQLFHTVQDHMRLAMHQHIGSISHRSTQFKDIFKNTTDQLRALMAIPKDYTILFTGSATEVWERIIQNLVRTHSMHLVNGAFSEKFYEIAKSYGKKTTLLSSVEGEIPLLPGSPPEGVEMVAVTHNETSTGVSYPLAELQKIRELYPDAIISLDVVSSVPDVEIPWEYVDTVYFSVQKGMGLPAGLGVWVVNDRCIERAADNQSEGHIIGSYHALPTLASMAEKYQTPETPPVLLIYLLGKVTEDMLTRGIDAIRRETKQKAAILNILFEEHPLLRPFVSDGNIRSKTVLIAETRDGSNDLIRFVAEKGMILGQGYGKFKNDHIRIANFPVHSKEQIEYLADIINNFS